jgi:hypothetical protein
VNANEVARVTADVSTATFIGGGVAVGVAVLLLVTAPSSSSAAKRAWISPRSASLGLRF